MELTRSDGVWDTVEGADLQRELRSRKAQYIFETIDKSKKIHMNQMVGKYTEQTRNP